MYLKFKRASMALCMGLTSVAALAQSTVRGTVTDASGEPMIGVTINMDGKAAAITDLDGNFSIPNAQPQSKIKVSYVGYKEQTMTVGNQNTLKIVLAEDNAQLDEIVVVGYGTMKKKDLTGAVANVKASDIASVSSANALTAMQGTVTGVDMQQSDGQAGSSISMTMRGNRSLLASNNPLVLVDGVEYGSTLDIPAGDIESIDVLKDAASTAIYGTKGSNGVIIITTKRGKAGKTHVNFNAYLSANSATGVTKSMYGDKEVQRLIDAQDYKNMKNSGDWSSAQRTTTAENVLGLTLDDGTSCLDIYNNKSYTDWLDMILENSVSQNYELSVSGGNDKTQYNMSLADMVDKGLMAGDKYNRYSGRTSIDHRINKYVKVGTNLNYTYKSNDKRNSGVFNQAQKMTTITHAYQEDGVTPIAQPNPWYAAHCSPLLDENGNYQRNVETSRFFGGAYAEFNAFKGFTFKTNFTLDRSTYRDGLYQDYESQGRYQSPSTTYISNTKDTKTKYIWQNTANYNITVAEHHDLTFLLGHEMTKSNEEYSSIHGDAGKEHYYQNSFYDVSKITDADVESTFSKQTMVSFFGRVNYSFDSKYLFQATLRTDGSSTLAKGHKWGWFPSVSAGWRVSDEVFMKDTKSWLEDLKLRVSYGVSGNPAVDPYQTLATISSIVPNSTEMAPMTMANEELSWEKTSVFDIGIDFSLLGGRVYGSLDYYNSHTNDLLWKQTNPASTVYTEIIANVGKTKGHGWELSLGAVPVKTKEFKWDVNATATFSRDYVDELANGLSEYVDGNTILRVGSPVSAYYDYEVQNCWNVGEFEEYVEKNYTSQGKEFTKPYTDYGDPGTPKVVDQNGDGVIDSDDKIVYNRTPKAIIGFNTSLTYKDFTLSVKTMGRFGNYMSYGAYGLYTYDGSNWGDLDYWTPDNTNTIIPSPGASGSTPTNYKTAIMMQKADYFKIKDVTLSYSVPKTALKKVFMSNARIYCSLKNFFTFSHFDNYDPERGGSVSFPLSKQVVVGINVTF